jgi:hypothetical protein
MKIPLNSGAYSNRALISNAQACINLFPENNPAESSPASPFTHYPRPGLISLGAPATQGRGRGVYRASNGDLYGVVGPNVYYIDPNFVFNQIGTIQNQFTPVSFADNGQSNGNAIVLVDNSPLGYEINMTSRQLTQIVDPTGLFTGATMVVFFDTFFAFNQIGTNNWYVSLSEQVAFNALDIASKGTYGDPIQGLTVNQRNIWLIGAMTAEPWFDAGDPIFPFEEVFGQFVQHGTIAPYSICQTDVNAFYLSQDKDGRAIFLMIEGYAAKRISTYALEDEWLTYPRRSDVICNTYQQGGHTFIGVHFPSADITWYFDLATHQWHRRAWIDNNGTLHRDRVAFTTMAYDTIVGMDWATGQLYALDQNTFTDNGQPIVYRRSFPHFVNEMSRSTVVSFIVDMQTGTLSGSSEGSNFANAFNSGFSNGFGPISSTSTPQVGVRVSKDGGASFGNYRLKSMISAGHNRSVLRYRGLGQARDWVFEVTWSAPFSTGLNQAFIEAIGHGS